jgi:drug/metabolite transporter (DMT)-like permease
MMIVRKRWQELRNLKAWKYAFGIAIFNGVLYYGLYFYGLTKTVSANGAIVALFEVVTSYLFFQVIHKETIPKKHILGIILTTCGALFIFIPKFGHFYIGDLFILLATFFAPFGNRYAQKARKIVSGETVLFIRNIITMPLLFILALFFCTSPLVQPLGNSVWWLLLNGLIILGLSKVFWMEGIHRMSVTKALAISSLSPFFTIIFAWLIIGQKATPAQFISLPLLIAGVFLLTNVSFKGIFKLNKKELS